MEKEKLKSLIDRLQSMDETQREALDPICKAISEYRRVYNNGKGWRLLTTRDMALAAIDLCEEKDILYMSEDF